VQTPEQLRQALAQARLERRTCVVVVETEKHRNLPGGGVWWDVAPAEVSQEPITQKLRAEYLRDRAQLQRFHY
jgi:3D-(3,5/4)-trihydroxycyclohexane-1,2-dione acylhydrolase (decyclizing)